MSWYKKAKLNISTMYHTTTPSRLNDIKRDGLKVGSEWEKTTGGKDLVEKGYGGIRPIFLSKRPREFFGKGDVVLKIDTSGLPLAADIPSLYDKGGYMAEEGIYFEEDFTPYEFIDHVDEDGMLYYEDLADTASEVSQIAIIMTGTAVCFADISPERIQVM